MQQPAPLGTASSSTVLATDWLLFARVAAAPASAPFSTLTAAAPAAMLVHVPEQQGQGANIAPRPLR